MSYTDDRQAGDEIIEITGAMLEAAVYAMREHCLGSPLCDLARLVYVAMETERRAQTKPSASAISVSK